MAESTRNLLSQQEKSHDTYGVNGYFKGLENYRYLLFFTNKAILGIKNKKRNIVT